ncbi:MAG: hypothetical protein GXY86_10215 [Firmicutes bacterium]|nr:hypothetical protein [Bacillota bacterium]
MNNIKNSISFLLKDNIELIEGTSTHSFPIHTHQIFCIGIVTRGSLRFIINNLEYSLRENSIYLVPPGKSHSIYADNHHE